MNATPESLIKDYADPIEQQEIDKFVCSEMGRQIHRYIKGMSGTKQAMLKFEERLASLSVPEKEKAIAKYIDLNRKALDGLDLKMILVRSVANYCDTFQYMLDFVNDKRKMVFYYQRIKAKYIQYHEVFEQDGKFGMKDHQGNILLSPTYDFLRNCLGATKPTTELMFHVLPAFKVVFLLHKPSMWVALPSSLQEFRPIGVSRPAKI